jgi:hypothetical protein
VRCAAQPSSSIITEATPRPGAVPFSPGERLEYSASFGRVHVGSGRMVLSGSDTVRGRRAWKAAFTISGGFWRASVHDSMTSWFDSLTLTSLRSARDLHELRRKASNLFEIYPDRGVYKQRDEPERPTVPDPLDDISFVYFVRTLSLEPGQCYELTRYFRPEGNPVVIRVVRRERVTVPAGTFNAILVQPEITTSAIFSRNGRAELWLSDDSRHVPVKLQTSLPFGSINLYLSKVERGPVP